MELHAKLRVPKENTPALFSLTQMGKNSSLSLVFLTTTFVQAAQTIDMNETDQESVSAEAKANTSPTIHLVYSKEPELTLPKTLSLLMCL